MPERGKERQPIPGVQRTVITRLPARVPNYIAGDFVATPKPVCGKKKDQR